MTKNQAITRLTPAACQKIQAEMLTACRKIVRSYGLVIEGAGSGSRDPGFSYETAFRVSIPAPDGEVFNPDKELFEILAGKYGLSPEDFGREFSTGRERFRIVGIETRRPKYPISVERIPDRQGYKFAAENVAMLLKAQKKP